VTDPGTSEFEIETWEHETRGEVLRTRCLLDREVDGEVRPCNWSTGEVPMPDNWRAERVWNMHAIAVHGRKTL
jgi:hypothetical protein